MIDVLNQNISTLSQSEQDQLFELLTDNARLFLKLIPSAPLLKYIVSGYTDSTDPVIQAYTAWKSNN